MKILAQIFLILIIIQDKIELKNKIVEISCGQCQFGSTEKQGCDLAIRYDNRVYFVKKSKIDDFGDAHAKDGFCNTIRKAEVSGLIDKNIFIDSKVKLLNSKKE
jgi:hypothetical protein